MSPADARRDRAAGRDWFLSLSAGERWAVGDDLVLGTFDWRDWGFERRPSAAFLNGADAARMLWEDQ